MTANPRSMTPCNNYGAGGESRRLVDISRAYSDVAVVWQRRVYQVGREVAQRIGAKRIVDIGAGGGQKLLDSFSDFDAELLQVDWVDRRERIEGNILPPFFKANLEDGCDTDALRVELNRNEPTLIILSDVIEHLNDPRLLLRAIRATLKKNDFSRLIISTPDRNRIDGVDSESMPDNPTHFRQWTIQEFRLMLEASGFCVEDIFFAPQTDFDNFNRTIIAEISCGANFYAQFLEKSNLPPSSDHLVITTEHSHALRTGGIGTYYQVAENYSGHKRLFMYCGGAGLPEPWRTFVRTTNWLHCSDLAGRDGENLEAICHIDYHEILAATQLVIFLYDQITLVEYQDYLGLGVHVAQAKRARMLPASIFVMAYAHGNHLYLDNAQKTISPERDLSIDVRERLSVELADCVVFPSKYLEDLYLKVGGFLPRRHVFQPYPTDLGEADLIETQFGKVTTLIFYGKHTEHKGYFDFCQAVLDLFNDSAYEWTGAQIKKIVILGSTTPDERLFNLQGIEIVSGVFSRDEAVEKLHELAPHSLVVMPYKGDNHPLSTFEVINSNSQFVAYRAGGLPEQLPVELHARVLCEPNHRSLADAIQKSVRMDFWERCELIKACRLLTAQKYEIHGKEYVNLLESFKRTSYEKRCRPGDVSVIVPNFNGSAAFLNDAILGLRSSFKKPKEVFFVDDCSNEGNFKILEEKVADISEFQVRLLRNERNIGLAATRNVGLSRIATEYVCAHDNDNVILNQFLDIASRIMDENPEVAAVTSWTVAFADGDAWQSDETTSLKYKWRPLGPDVGLGLKENTFGDALSVYRTSELQGIGGWDGGSKALWEDWQLFLKLAALGKQIWVIPREMFLYRVRPTSMLQTYPKFDGWVRIANAIPGLPSNQRIGLLRSALAPDQHLLHERWQLQQAKFECEQRLSLLEGEVDRLRGIENSATWRATQGFRRWLTRHPKVRSAVRRSASLAVRLARKSRTLRGS